MRLPGKTIVITGAGSGLGRESALLFAQEGANVVVTDKIEQRVHDVVAAIERSGHHAVGLRADVTSEEDLNAAADSAVARFGRLDVMFANAGIMPEGFGTIPIDECSLEQWNAVNDVVFTGVFLAAKAATRVFKRQGDGGNIVVTGSAGGIMAYPGFFSYCAGKAGTHQLVKCLAFDLGRYGIRANALAPTHGMSVNFAMPPDADVLGVSYEQAAAAAAGGWDPGPSPIPLKLDSPPTLRDSANVALFLASDETRYMSGVIVPATDGGTLSRVSISFEEQWEKDLTPQHDEARAEQ